MDAYDEFEESNVSDISTLIPEEETRPAGTALLYWRGLGWARNIYDKTFRDLLIQRKNDFDLIRSIREDTKTRIQPIAFRYYERIVAYETWKAVLDKVAEDMLSVSMLLGLLVSVLAAPVWFRLDRSFAEWVFITFIGFIAYFFALVIIGITESWSPVGKWPFILLIIFSIIGGELGTRRHDWMLGFVQDGLMEALMGATVVLILYYATSWIVKLPKFLIDRRMKRRYPEEFVVYTLTWMLALTEPGLKDWRTVEYKNKLIVALEDVARRIEHELPIRLLSMDAGTNSWLRHQTGEIAAGVRQLKRHVLLPTKGDQQLISQAMSKLLVNATLGYWIPLHQAEVIATPSLISRVLYIMRKVVTAAFPLAIVAMLELTPIPMEKSVKSYIIGVSIIWTFINILSWLDPEYEKKLEGLAKVVSTIVKK